MANEASPMKVVMLPWLAYGHISPFLELAKQLSHRNTHTYLCSTPINLTSIKNKIPEKYTSSIHLIELHLPSSPELPPHHHTTNGLPLRLNSPLRKALDSSKPNFSNLLKRLKPDVVIHDALIQWAAAAAKKIDIPAVCFLTSGAMLCSFFCHTMMKPPGEEYPFPDIRLTGIEKDMFNSCIESVKKKSRERNSDNDDGVPNQEPNQSMLIKTSREIEGKYIDYLSQLLSQKVIPIGTLVGTDPENDDASCDLMEWLDKKDEFSTVFLSFGSEYFLKREEIKEIAYALELNTNTSFIWVIRSPAREEIQAPDVLPEGFLERVGDRGKVLEIWAPQEKILRHKSVGGFVSHCGWGSLMESIEFGVPVIAMPMHLDQPLNAKLVVELGVGVEVARDEKGRFTREAIGKVIGDVVGEHGQCLRRKVEEQRGKLRGRCEEEMDGVVHEIAQLCGKTNSTNI